TFNAPNPQGLAVHPPLVPQTNPPTVNGDNPEPPATRANFGPPFYPNPPVPIVPLGPYSNALTYEVTADTNGNIANMTPGNLTLQIPTTATPGSYLVEAYDEGSQVLTNGNITTYGAEGT